MGEVQDELHRKMRAFPIIVEVEAAGLRFDVSDQHSIFSLAG